MEQYNVKLLLLGRQYTVPGKRAPPPGINFQTSSGACNASGVNPYIVSLPVMIHGIQRLYDLSMMSADKTFSLNSHWPRIICSDSFRHIFIGNSKVICGICVAQNSFGIMDQYNKCHI